MLDGVVEVPLEDRLLVDRSLRQVLGREARDLEGGKKGMFASCLAIVGGQLRTVLSDVLLWSRTE